MTDKRLEGLLPAKVTLKFVRENASNEELIGAFYEYPKKRMQVDSKYLVISKYVGSFGVIQGLEKLLADARTELNSNQDVELHYTYDDEIEIRYYEFKKDPFTPDLKGEKALQKLWKDQIKEYNQKERDLKEYLRLKQKLGEN